MRRLATRFRIKTLLALVAIVAIGLGIIQTVRRWRDYRDLERSYAALHRDLSATLKDVEAQAPRYRAEAERPGITPKTAAQCVRRAEVLEAQAAYCRLYVKWYADRHAKYRHAAGRPWWSVPPDAPAPPEEMSRLQEEKLRLKEWTTR